MTDGTDCEEYRRALGRLHDGESPPGEAAGARAHARACPSCAAAEASLETVAARLRERGGPAPGAVPVAGLRDSVLGRIRRGEATAVELRPFLRRTAAAAAAVLVVATAAAFWQATLGRPAARDAAIPREELLAEIVGSRMGPRR